MPCAAWLGERRAERGWRAFRFTFTSNVRVRRRERDAAAGRTAARGSCLRARGRCPSGATASRGRRRRGRGSSRRACRRGRAFSSARTVSCTRCGLTSAPKTASSSVTSFAFLPAASSSGAFGAAISDLSSLISTRPFFGPGTAPLTSSRFRSASTSWTTRPTCVHALAAHPAGHLHALEDARRRRRRADRARLADVVRAVRHRAAREVVALDRALEALADARSR